MWWRLERLCYLKVWLWSLYFMPLHYILLRISLFTKRISFLLTSLNTLLRLLVWTRLISSFLTYKRWTNKMFDLFCFLNRILKFNLRILFGKFPVTRSWLPLSTVWNKILQFVPTAGTCRVECAGKEAWL